MLERIGTAVAILTDWRRRGSNPRERLDGTGFSLEKKDTVDHHIILITRHLGNRDYQGTCSSKQKLYSTIGKALDCIYKNENSVIVNCIHSIFQQCMSFFLS